MADEDEGLLLRQAIEAYSDPELWRAYDQAPKPLQRRRVYPSPYMAGGSLDFDRVRRERRAPVPPDPQEVAWRRVVADFKARLRSGELLATGIKLPPIGPPGAEPIAREVWDILQVDFAGSRAWTKGKELTYRGVRVRPATRDRPSDSGLLGRSRSPPVTPEPASDEHVRRNAADRIRAKMRRRKRHGLLTGNWTQDSRSLHDWARANVIGRKLPSGESIERRYRDLYKALMADNKGGQ